MVIFLKWLVFFARGRLSCYAPWSAMLHDHPQAENFETGLGNSRDPCSNPCNSEITLVLWIICFKTSFFSFKTRNKHKKWEFTRTSLVYKHIQIIIIDVRKRMTSCQSGNEVLVFFLAQHKALIDFERVFALRSRPWRIKSPSTYVELF